MPTPHPVPSRRLILSAVAAGLIAIQQATAAIIPAGSGSYTDSLAGNTACPEVDAWFPPSDSVIEAGGIPNPVSPKITSNLAGRKIPTNDWWSSLVWPVASNADRNFSYPMYAYPGVFKAISSGLEIDQQTPSRAVNQATAPEIPYDVDMRVGIAGLNATEARVHDFSDWTVTADWNNGALRATFGHGMPYVWFRTAAAATAVIDYAGVQSAVLQNSANVAVLRLDTLHYYAVIAPAGATWSQGANQLTSSLAGKTYFTVALLPATTDAEALAQAPYFRDRAFAFPTNATVAWSYNATTSHVTTSYTVATTLLESASGYLNNTIQCLFPHQYTNLSAGTILTSYQFKSIRGNMKAFNGNTFSTDLIYPGVLPTLPDETQYGTTGFDRAKLQGYQSEWRGMGLPTRDDTYNGGKNLGKAARAAFVANELGDIVARDRLVSETKRFLTDWYSVTNAEIADWADCGVEMGPPCFYYNNQWGSLVGWRAAFNTHTYLNDHHFHWGYFIYASAMVATYDPAWAASYEPMVELLIRDAAAPSATDPLFPRLRNFDPYMGHSWANGPAGNFRGNDHESTSEAMNFHAGTILWGTATNDTTMRDLGIYLYTTELSAIENYWFDVNDLTFDQVGFQRQVVGRVWGNAFDYQTHFGLEPWKVVGIQAVPVTASHLYLGRHPDRVSNMFAELQGYSGTEWGPLRGYLWMFESFFDPAHASSLFNAQVGNTVIDGGDTLGHMYYFIHDLGAFGTVERGITADIPNYAVFTKGGTRIHVAHNPTATLRRVTFSDGVWIDVPAGETISTRSPMSVALTSPANNAQVPLGTSVSFSATAAHRMGGTINRVEWRANGTTVASDTTSPYTGSWSPASDNVYSVVALAIDSTGREAWSTISEVTIGCGKSQTPFSGSPITVASTGTTTIQVENYDNGGQGAAYSDTNPWNEGGQYRTTEGVDIGTTIDTGTGFKVGYINTGEYLEYTINVQTAGTYRADLRVASPIGGGQVRFFSACRDYSSAVTLPNTGDWENWQTVTGPTMSLSAGTQILRADIVNGGFDMNWFSLTRISGATPSPSPTTGPTATPTTPPTASPTTPPTATPSGTATPPPTASPTSPPGGCTGASSGTSANGEAHWCVTSVAGGQVTVRFESAIGSTWADLHYTINGGAQQNVRMNVVGGGVHTWNITGATAGQTLNFFFTYQKPPGAVDSEWFSIVLSGGGTPTASPSASPSPSNSPTASPSPSASPTNSPSASPTASPSPTSSPTSSPTPTIGCTGASSGNSANGQVHWCLSSITSGQVTLTIETTNGAAWADVHYNINGGAQQNIRMTALGAGTHQWTISGVTAGQTLNFFFTYHNGVGAVDTEWFSAVLGGSSTPTSSPTTTPSPSPTTPPTATPSSSPTPTTSPTPTGGCSGASSGTSSNGQLHWCLGVVSGGQATITVETTTGATWADIHYNINGGAQQNIRMNVVGGGTHTWNITGVSAGQTLNFFITYQSGPGAIDTEWFSAVLTGGTPTPSPTPTTVTFAAVATEDGEVRESSETSGTGNTSSATGTTSRIGDDTSRREYRTILSFDTSSIPDGAVIDAATLSVTRTAVTSTPTALGAINVSIHTGGFGGNAALSSADFQNPASASNVATLPFPASNNTSVSASLNAAGRSAVNKTGRTQLRIQFATDDDNDSTADTLSFATGNHTTTGFRPTLAITYH